MKKSILGFMMACLFLVSTGTVYADLNNGISEKINGKSLSYKSTYESIQWGQRGDDTYYCIDICDENWNIYPGLQAIECGDNLYSWSPGEFVRSFGNGDLPDGFVFNWKVWSYSGYGGQGFEGQVIVEQTACQGIDYLSTSEMIQWGCRNNDIFYCIDIFDSDWSMIYQAIKCEEGLHSYSPKELNLAPGTYYWKVWSQSGYGENGFWGEFNVNDSNCLSASAISGKWGVNHYDYTGHGDWVGQIEIFNDLTVSGQQWTQNLNFEYIVYGFTGTVSGTVTGYPEQKDSLITLSCDNLQYIERGSLILNGAWYGIISMPIYATAQYKVVSTATVNDIDNPTNFNGDFITTFSNITGDFPEGFTIYGAVEGIRN